MPSPLYAPPTRKLKQPPCNWDPCHSGKCLSTLAKPTPAQHPTLVLLPILAPRHRVWRPRRPRRPRPNLAIGWRPCHCSASKPCQCSVSQPCHCLIWCIPPCQDILNDFWCKEGISSVFPIRIRGNPARPGDHAAYDRWLPVFLLFSGLPSCCCTLSIPSQAAAPLFDVASKLAGQAQIRENRH